MTGRSIPELEWIVQHARQVARSRGRHLAPEQQDDVAQAALEKYVVAAATSAPPRNVAAWLEIVVRNLVVDAQRKEGRVDPADPDDPEDPIGFLRRLGADLRTPSVAVLAERLADDLLGLVPSPDRRVLELRFLEGFSSREVGAQLGISANAVDQRVRQARVRLQAALGARPDLVKEVRRGHPHLYPR